jgi:hypothetical protein
MNANMSKKVQRYLGIFLVLVILGSLLALLLRSDGYENMVLPLNYVEMPDRKLAVETENNVMIQ